MDKSLLVAVFVPTTDASGTDYKGLEGFIATGYPVAPDLILTARHLFHPDPPTCRDQRYPVKVRWHYYRQHPEADKHGWIPLADDAMVWPGTPELDAVLVRCQRPQGVVGWGVISEEAPTDDMNWVSEGFPRASVYDVLRNPSSFGGACFSKAPGEQYFELSALAPPEDEEDWRGASGMPIFVGRRLLGVAQRVPRKFGAERLHATPCRKLLANSQFRAALGFDDRQALVSKVRRRLAERLTPASVVSLAQAFDVEAELAGLEAAQQADTLAQRLLDSDIRFALGALRKAHRELAEEKGQEVAGALVEVALLVVPTLFDQGVIHHAKAAQDMTLVPLPAGTRTVAEIVMAGVDGRAAHFRARESEDHQPEGDLSLPLHPEPGIGGDASIALAGHLKRKLDPGAEAIRQLRTSIDDYLLGTFARPEPGAPVRERAERILLSADLLEDRRRDTGQTFYMVFYLPNDATERQSMETLVHELKRDYKAIAFLGLDPAFRQERADRKLVDPLCRMLPHAVSSVPKPIKQEKESIPMATFDQRNQQVTYQYNAAGDINIGSIRNNQDLLEVLKKLQGELAAAAEQQVLSEDTATDAEYHIKKAVQQAAKPDASKERILEHLDKVKALIGGTNALISLAKGIEWAMEKVRDIF
jgi:hypothetical protein